MKSFYFIFFCASIYKMPLSRPIVKYVWAPLAGMAIANMSVYQVIRRYTPVIKITATPFSPTMVIISCTSVNPPPRGVAYIHTWRVHNKDGTTKSISARPLDGADSVVHAPCVRVLTPQEYANASSITVAASASPYYLANGYPPPANMSAYLMHWLTVRSYSLDLTNCNHNNNNK